MRSRAYQYTCTSGFNRHSTPHHICVTLQSHYEPSNVPPTKTATLNLRIDPTIKEALRIAALREHRSVANLIELLIRKHCKAAHIEIPTQAELFGAKESGDG